VVSHTSDYTPGDGVQTLVLMIAYTILKFSTIGNCYYSILCVFLLQCKLVQGIDCWDRFCPYMYAMLQLFG
jgi:hypothetical protein